VTLYLSPLLGAFPLANALFYGGSAAIALLSLAGLWWLFGPGPRRTRAYNRAQRLLHKGDWQEALAIIKSLQVGRLSQLWQGRLQSGEGECLHAAAQRCLREKEYEDSLAHFQTAAGLLHLDAAELRSRVVEGMLADVRQQFAACKSAADNQNVQALLARLQKVEPSCPEAVFWQALCDVRKGNVQAAMTALAASHEQGGKHFLDPPLYLGTLKVRDGQVQEGLRLLGEANRIDTNCPLVSLELGAGMVAANGDSAIAARALQRALGQRGLAPWLKRPHGLWTDTFPEGRSYVWRLAQKHPFICPVFGNDVAALSRHGEFALAHAEYRQGHFQESADRFSHLLQDAPPSAPLLRGLGLSLARLERYDQAYKHLRAALDMEEPKDPLTAGYLALCGARGKPLREEDKVRNVEWAIALLGRFSLPGDAEWGRIYGAVFAEARALGLSPAVEDQVKLCEALRGVDAVDPESAAAYSQLAAASPESVRPEYAWLYCRAAQIHAYTSGQDLDLFGRTFCNESAARAFYTAHQWNLDETAFTYLERCAAQRPGHFPEEFGADYPKRGEDMLLARSEQLQISGQKEAALAAVEVLVKLAPSSPRAHDRLAHLLYQRGDLDRATSILVAWQKLAPTDPQPAIKRAIVEQQRGNNIGRDDAIRRAMELTHGADRASVAFLGARLTLSSVSSHQPAAQARDTSVGPGDSTHPTNPVEGNDVDWNRAKELLRTCLHEQPDHADALSCLAMVCSFTNDYPGLIELSLRMDRPDVSQPRFHYMAAVCHAAAEDYARVLTACARAMANADAALANSCEYLKGWAHLQLGDEAAALTTLDKVARSAGSPSADSARAVTARLKFNRQDYDEAGEMWKAIDARRRTEWQLDEPLQQTTFLSALTAMHAERFEEAAEKFREAGRLGLRDRRLGSLLTLCLMKAGQRLLYQEEAEAATYQVLNT
jgi:tetratricopeptide (TPR) repeat protein